jgi:hypothetical protein
MDSTYNEPSGKHGGGLLKPVVLSFNLLSSKSANVTIGEGFFPPRSLPVVLIN